MVLDQLLPHPGTPPSLPRDRPPRILAADLDQAMAASSTPPGCRPTNDALPIPIPVGASTTPRLPSCRTWSARSGLCRFLDQLTSNQGHPRAPDATTGPRPHAQHDHPTPNRLRETWGLPGRVQDPTRGRIRPTHARQRLLQPTLPARLPIRVDLRSHADTASQHRGTSTSITWLDLLRARSGSCQGSEALEDSEKMP